MTLAPPLSSSVPLTLNVPPETVSVGCAPLPAWSVTDLADTFEPMTG